MSTIEGIKQYETLLSKIMLKDIAIATDRSIVEQPRSNTFLKCVEIY